MTHIRQNSARAIFLVTVCTALVGGTGSAEAHDIWLTADKVGDQYTAQVDFGELEARENADFGKIVSFDLVTPSGSTDLRHPLTAGELNGKPVLTTRPFSAPVGSVLAVSYDNGFWMQLGKDKNETNTSKLMVPDGASPHWTVKFSKLLLGPGSFNRALGMRLEIVPLKDPYTLSPGAKLPC